MAIMIRLMLRAKKGSFALDKLLMKKMITFITKFKKWERKKNKAILLNWGTDICLRKVL